MRSLKNCYSTCDKLSRVIHVNEKSHKTYNTWCFSMVFILYYSIKQPIADRRRQTCNNNTTSCYEFIVWHWRADARDVTSGIFQRGVPRNYNDKLSDTSNYRIVRSLSFARPIQDRRWISFTSYSTRSDPILVVYSQFPRFESLITSRTLWLPQPELV